jgi:hypothetical protein
MHRSNQICPNCSADISGLYSRVPNPKWYGSSTVRGCAACGKPLSYDGASKKWLLLNLGLSVPLFWPGKPPNMLLAVCIVIALLGDVMFVATRKIVIATKMDSPN